MYYVYAVLCAISILIAFCMACWGGGILGTVFFTGFAIVCSLQQVIEKLNDLRKDRL